MTNKDNDRRKLMDEHPHVESKFKDSPQYIHTMGGTGKVQQSED